MRKLIAGSFLYLILPAVASFASGPFDGTWRMDLPRPGNVTLQTYFVLHQDGTNLSGKVVINDSNDLDLRKPRVDGTNAEFSVDWNTAYRLSLEGDRLRVTLIYSGNGRENAEGRRVDPSQAQPPLTKPLPALMELPANGLAKTPPMGWNSWNHFGCAIDDATVRSVADAMATNGMAAAGYKYINIDDGWQAGRDGSGRIVPNTKFPDMKALADYVHSKGLKLGIYSSPGPKTCGGYEGSFGHEEQDAKTYAEWGIDYLKYDWCSAARVYREDQVRIVYQKMGAALAKCGRPIVYSFCEYGMGDVWTWGPLAGGNLWRTTGDIQDNWKSMSEIGFNQGRLAVYAGPGHWNDPDMLEVGNGGMTPVEYRTHFSLWCLLAAPLLAGNDLRNMTADTAEILTNHEAIAINQDSLGQQGHPILKRGVIEAWSKPLENGATAIGIFNRGDSTESVQVTWKDLGLKTAPKSLRDLWEHNDIAPAADGWGGMVVSHGVVLLLLK
ncbi:MAG: glycoside hydrolase family 27 protein [Verrucomicrobiota bacterium]